MQFFKLYLGVTDLLLQSGEVVSKSKIFFFVRKLLLRGVEQRSNLTRSLRSARDDKITYGYLP